MAIRYRSERLDRENQMLWDNCSASKGWWPEERRKKINKNDNKNSRKNKSCFYPGSRRCVAAQDLVVDVAPSKLVIYDLETWTNVVAPKVDPWQSVAETAMGAPSESGNGGRAHVGDLIH